MPVHREYSTLNLLYSYTATEMPLTQSSPKTYPWHTKSLKSVVRGSEPQPYQILIYTTLLKTLNDIYLILLLLSL